MTLHTIDYGSRARVGLLLPSVNQAAEPQLRLMLPADVALSTTRLKLDSTDESALLGMARDVEGAAALVADSRVDIIVFHCTAVSTYSQDLESSIIERIHAATGLPVMATSQALQQALEAVEARRIVMVSPYPDDVNRREARYFEAQGVDVLGFAGPKCRTAAEMMAVQPLEWMRLTEDASHPDADAYVLSCTTVRTAECIEALERRLGRPVITSNSAVAWALLRQLRIDAPVEGYGAMLAAGGRPLAAHRFAT